MYSICGKLGINGDVDHWSLLGSPAPKDYDVQADFSADNQAKTSRCQSYITHIIIYTSVAKRGLPAPGLLREVVSCPTDTAREGGDWVRGAVLGGSRGGMYTGGGVYGGVYGGSVYGGRDTHTAATLHSPSLGCQAMPSHISTLTLGGDITTVLPYSLLFSPSTSSSPRRRTLPTPPYHG